MAKNKNEYKIGNFQKRCCICREFTPLRIMRVTNNVEFIDKATIKIESLDLDKCVRFVRTHASVINDPTLVEYVSAYGSGSSYINDGVISVRTGQYNYSTQKYPERVVWTGPEKFGFDYTVYGLLARRSLLKFKGDKAIKNNILALFKDYNDKVTNRYSSDSEYEGEPCCSDACLNMWLLRK